MQTKNFLFFSAFAFITTSLYSNTAYAQACGGGHGPCPTSSSNNDDDEEEARRIAEEEARIAAEEEARRIAAAEEAARIAAEEEARRIAEEEARRLAAEQAAVNNDIEQEITAVEQEVNIQEQENTNPQISDELPPPPEKENTPPVIVISDPITVSTETVTYGKPKPKPEPVVIPAPPPPPFDPTVAPTPVFGDIICCRSDAEKKAFANSLGFPENMYDALVYFIGKLYGQDPVTNSVLSAFMESSTPFNQLYNGQTVYPNAGSRAYLINYLGEQMMQGVNILLSGDPMQIAQNTPQVALAAQLSKYMKYQSKVQAENMLAAFESYEDEWYDNATPFQKLMFSPPLSAFDAPPLNELMETVSPELSGSYFSTATAGAATFAGTAAIGGSTFVAATATANAAFAAAVAAAEGSAAAAAATATASAASSAASAAGGVGIGFAMLAMGGLIAADIIKADDFKKDLKEAIENGGADIDLGNFNNEDGMSYIAMMFVSMMSDTSWQN